MPAASLGHYAALSFVVIGRGQRIGFGLRICRYWIFEIVTRYASKP